MLGLVIVTLTRFKTVRRTVYVFITHFTGILDVPVVSMLI